MIDCKHAENFAYFILFLWILQAIFIFWVRDLTKPVAKIIKFPKQPTRMFNKKKDAITLCAYHAYTLKLGELAILDSANCLKCKRSIK